MQIVKNKKKSVHGFPLGIAEEYRKKLPSTFRVSSALSEGGPDELGGMGALCLLRV